MRDTRSIQIKKLLKKDFPTYEFKVRISKYSMGESINVYTSLIDEVREMSEQEIIEYKTNNNSEPYNDVIKSLRETLKGYESVDRDQFGEILSGGNTYLFFSGLEYFNYI